MTEVDAARAVGSPRAAVPVVLAPDVHAVVHAVVALVVNALLVAHVVAEPAPAAHAAVQPVVSVVLVAHVAAVLAVHAAFVRVAVVARSAHVAAGIVALHVEYRVAIGRVVVASDRRVAAADVIDPVNDLTAYALVLHCHAPDYSAT